MIVSLSVTLFGVLVASVLRGFTGFGFGLAAVPILSLALPPTQVVPLAVTLQVAIGASGIMRATKDCDWRAVGALTPGLLIGIPIGLTLLTAFPPNTVRLAIGVIVAGSVVLIQRGLRLPPNPSRLIGFGIGTVSGIVSGLASMGGPPVVVYMLALGHSAARMRATAIVYFMLSGCVSLIPMIYRGLITQEILIWTAASFPVMIAASRLGTWAFHRANPRHHRLVALWVLSVLSATLILRALLG